MPHFPIYFTHAPSARYYPKLGGFLAAISSEKGAAWDVDGLPMISAKSWEIMGCVSTSQEAPFWKLIAAKDPPNLG